MGEITIPCIDNKCAVEGADVADRSCRDNNAPSGLEDEQNGSQNASNRDHNSDSITGTSTSSNLARDVGAEGSEAVRLLDEELEELEKLISLQRRRIDALERLRRQWISGERKLADVPYGSGTHNLAGTEGAEGTTVALGQDPFDRERQERDAFPPMGRFEHYMVPHSRIPLASPVVAMEMLSFRLKGQSRASERSGKTSGGRPGFITIIASLHADGVVHLHDTDGEEVLSFDSGHTTLPATAAVAAPTKFVSPVEPAAAGLMVPATAEVVGLTGDASEGNPVLVTAGTDGTMRVHVLTVRLHGKRVAGRRDVKEKSRGGRSDGGSSRRREQPKSPTADGERSGGDVDRTRKPSSGPEAGRTDVDGPSSSLPMTALGVGASAEFRVCLGSACVDGSRDGQAARVEETGQGRALPTKAADVATSMDAFYHRAMGTVVVIAGYSSGGVRFFHSGNGTVLGSTETGSAVLAVKRSGQSIAFSDGQVVRFASASKFEPQPGRVCRGRRGFNDGRGDEAMVTALEFDAASPGILYVGTETGKVMGFNHKLQEVDGSYRCLPAYQLPSTFDDSPKVSQAAGTGSGGDRNGGRGQDGCDAISSVRGYVIVSHGALLSVYNTTEEARLLFAKRHVAGDMSGCGDSNPGGDDGHTEDGVTIPFAPKWSVISSAVSGEALVIEAARCASEVTVYKATLPYNRHVPDMLWMRVPILLLGLVVVAITQAYSRRTAKATVARARRSGKGWRGGSNDDDDDDVLMNNRGLGLGSDLTTLREGSEERGSSRRGWGGRSGLGEPPLESASRSLADRPQRYGDQWEQGSSDS